MQAAITPYSVALLATLDCASKREQRRWGSCPSSRSAVKSAAATFVASKLIRSTRPLGVDWASFALDVENHLNSRHFLTEVAGLSELALVVEQRLKSLDQFSDFHQFLLRVTAWLSRPTAPRIERSSLLGLFGRAVALRLRIFGFNELQNCFEVFRRFLTEESQPSDFLLLLEPNHFFLLQQYVKQSLEDNEGFDFCELEKKLQKLAVPQPLRDRLPELFRGTLGGYLEALQPGRVPAWHIPSRFHAFLDASIARFFPPAGPDSHPLIQKAVLLSGLAKLRNGSRTEALTNFADAIRFGQNNKDEKTIGAGLAFLASLHAEQLHLEEQAAAVESFFALSINQGNPLLLFCMARQQLALEGTDWKAKGGRAQPPIINLLLKGLYAHLEKTFFDRRERMNVCARPFSEYWNALHFQLMQNCAGHFALTHTFFESFLEFSEPPSADKTRGFFALLGLVAEEEIGRCHRLLSRARGLLVHSPRLTCWEWGLLRLKLLHCFELHQPAELLREQLECDASTAIERLRLLEAELETREEDEEYWKSRGRKFSVEGLKEFLELRIAVCCDEQQRTRGDAKGVLMRAIEHGMLAQKLGAIEQYIRSRVVEAWALAENDHLTQAEAALEDLSGLVHHANKSTKTKVYFETASLRLRQTSDATGPGTAFFANLRLALQCAVDIIDFAAVKRCLFFLTEVLRALGRDEAAEKSAASFMAVAKLQLRGGTELTRCEGDIASTLSVCADCSLLLQALIAKLF